MATSKRREGPTLSPPQSLEPLPTAFLHPTGFLIADYLNNRVRRVSPGGTTTAVAGTGAEGFSGDGGPATAARLGFPNSVSATADAGFLIADYINNRVRRVSPTGTITTAAGTGGWGFSGDGGPAKYAQLNSVAEAVETPDGGLLIVDTGNNRVRRVSPAGTITTVAGVGGFPGSFSGDGGLATLAGLDAPGGVAATASGDFLIADTSNNRVRFVDADLR
jgi:NHL repeat